MKKKQVRKHISFACKSLTVLSGSALLPLLTVKSDSLLVPVFAVAILAVFIVAIFTVASKRTNDKVTNFIWRKTKIK